MRSLLIILMAMMLGSCATTYRLTNQYQTLGHYVNEYSDGYENYYEIYSPNGELVAQANMLGFVQWKRTRLLELIGNESTQHAERERYKLEYEDISRRLDMLNGYLLQKNMMRGSIAPQVQSRSIDFCKYSKSGNC